MEYLKKYFRRLDLPLLVFLVLFLNVKLYVKAVAVVLAVCLNRKGEWIRPAWLRFYAAMIFLALVNALLSIRSMSLPAWIAFGLGCVYWLLAMLAAWQVFLFVQRGDREKVHATVSALFVLNAYVMLLSLVLICIDAGALNPYSYEGQHRKFFISTGDMITGIGMDSSVSAALVSAVGLLYFLYRGRLGYAVLCLVTVLLATSNTVNLLLGVVLVLALLLYSDRLQKSMIIIFFGLMIVFAAKVSPSNQQYARNLLGRMLGKNAYVEPVPIPHAKWNEFVESGDMARKEGKLHLFMEQQYSPEQADSIKHQYTAWRLSGRQIAWQELGRFFREHPAKLLLGAGMGNFSSQLAFRTTGLGIEGSYPERYSYIHPLFRENYLFIYLYYHTRDEGQHSVINKPDSVYGQLLAEYGLAGLGCFIVLYLAVFGWGLWKRRARSYGIPLLVLMIGAFFTEYWFEQLSVVMLFELLMLLDKEACIQKSPY